MESRFARLTSTAAEGGRYSSICQQPVEAAQLGEEQKDRMTARAKVIGKLVAAVPGGIGSRQLLVEQYIQLVVFTMLQHAPAVQSFLEQCFA